MAKIGRKTKQEKKLGKIIGEIIISFRKRKRIY